MGRKRINIETLTNAERQERFRQKRKSEIESAREEEQRKYYRRGIVHALCRAALFFEKCDRHDIAVELLREMQIEQSDLENPDNVINKLLREDLQRYGLYPLKK